MTITYALGGMWIFFCLGNIFQIFVRRGMCQKRKGHEYFSED
jgi:hypothetical protein